MNRYLPLCFLALVAFLTLIYKLGDLPFIGADEPRYARIGEEMAASGDWVTPRLLGRPWLEKPPLLFWMEAASFRLFGVSEFTARFPNVILALLSVASLGILVRRLVDDRSSYLACLVLLTSGLFLVFSRAASTDLPLAATITAALSFAGIAMEDRHICWGALAGAFLGMASLAKGPVALFLFAAIFSVLLIALDRFPWRAAQIAAGLGAFALVAMPWYIAVWIVNGDNFLITFWLNHHLARYLTDLHHHSEPFWYYLPVLLGGFFPWVVFLPGSLAGLWKQRNDPTSGLFRLELLLWIWAAVPFLFFSASSSKLAGYILPSIPPLAALVGIQWERQIRGELSVYGSMKKSLQILAVVVLLLIPLLVVAFQIRYSAWPSGSAVAAPLLGSLVLGYLKYRQAKPAGLFLVIAGGMTLTLAMLYQQAGPVVSKFHSTASLIRPVKHALTQHEPLVFYRFFHHSAQYYSEYHTTRDTVNNPQGLRDYMKRHPQSRYLLLTQEGGGRELAEIAGGTVLQQSGPFLLVEIPGQLPR